MPAWVKDENRWSAAKKAAGKETKEGSDSYWRLSNYIYHKMGKTELDKSQAEFYKNELKKSLFISASSGMPKSQTAMPKPNKVGQVPVKTPKAKKLPGAMDKPSVFFKSEMETFDHVKHPNLMKLKKFLLNKRQGQ